MMRKQRVIRGIYSSVPARIRRTVCRAANTRRVVRGRSLGFGRLNAVRVICVIEPRRAVSRMFHLDQFRADLCARDRRVGLCKYGDRNRKRGGKRKGLNDRFHDELHTRFLFCYEQSNSYSVMLV